eukprot:6214711-Pleurochrysis_carterae.AAC.6
MGRVHPGGGATRVPRIGLPSDRRGLRGGAATEVSDPARPQPRTTAPRAARPPGHQVGYVAVGGVVIAVDTTRCVGSRPKSATHSDRRTRVAKPSQSLASQPVTCRRLHLPCARTVLARTPRVQARASRTRTRAVPAHAPCVRTCNVPARAPACARAPPGVCARTPSLRPPRASTAYTARTAHAPCARRARPPSSAPARAADCAALSRARTFCARLSVSLPLLSPPPSPSPSPMPSPSPSPASTPCQPPMSSVAIAHTVAVAVAVAIARAVAVAVARAVVVAVAHAVTVAIAST